MNSERIFSDNAKTLLNERYLLDINDPETGNVRKETWSELCMRTATAIAKASIPYNDRNYEEEVKEYYDAIRTLVFIPATPILMNAGTEKQQLFSCFVTQLQDNLKSIYAELGLSAEIFSGAGGVGYDFGELRPEGSKVAGRGISSGALSFMKLYDTSCGIIKIGSGSRRGAMLAALPVDHPEILEFIKCKQNGKDFKNFNVSVVITDEFMAAVKMDGDYELKSFKNNPEKKTLRARKVFNAIVNQAWKTGEPGILFLDTANKFNPTPKLGRYRSSNPCGEVVGIDGSVCCLGHVNFATIVKDGKIDYAELERRIRLGIRFLDNCIDVNKYPHDKFKKVSLATRTIGLGFAGFADMLAQLNIRYGSDECIKLIDEIGSKFQEISHDESFQIALKRGNYPAFENKTPLRRNASTNTIAPTGSVAMIADCSYGVEPYFAIAFIKNCMEGVQMKYGNKYFEAYLNTLSPDVKEEVLSHAQKYGTIRNIDKKLLPDYIIDTFVTAHDIAPKERVMVQATWQKYIDLSISSTVNMPEDSKKEDVAQIYTLAWEQGCKGITVYRSNSRKEQVLNIGAVNTNTYTCEMCGTIHHLEEGLDPAQVCIKCSCGHKSCA